MKKSTWETLWTMIYIVAGLTGGWLTWFFLPGRKMAQLPPKLLPFLILGLAGALIYAAVRLRGLGYAILMVILLFFLQMALTPPLRKEAAIRAGIWAAPFGVGFIATGYLFRLLRRVPLGKFILMGIMAGLAQAVAAAVFRIRAGETVSKVLLLWQVTIGGMLGIFLGILIEIFELLPIRKRETLDREFPPI
ncbi:MAG: hypothetical protein ABIK39_04700 [candidate division WOR-3 bacterium]